MQEYENKKQQRENERQAQMQTFGQQPDGRTIADSQQHDSDFASLSVINELERGEET